MIFQAACIFILLKTINAQNSNPCPDILRYEDKQIDRWTAIIALESDEALDGLWLRINLDSPANLLINWLGEVSSKDNQEYIIRNHAQKLEAKKVLNLKIKVTYSPVDVAPSIFKIRLNGRTICSKNKNQLNQTKNTTTTIENIDELIDSLTTQKSTKKIDSAEIFPGDIFWLNSNENKVECGTRAKKARPLITFGTTSIKGDWPWHAALFRVTEEETKYICGGTLVNKNYVLTAAHCVTRVDTSRALQNKVFLVHLGRTYLNIKEDSQQKRNILKVIVHPNYNSTYFQEDLALLKLSQPVHVNDFVRPICLWSEGMDKIPTQPGTVVGWGITENHTLTDHLQETKMPYIDKIKCIYSNPDFFNKYTSYTSYCAGYGNGSSVCIGDSGSGMYFPKGSDDDTKWEIRGIVSVSLALQRKTCDTFSYAVFSDVAHHLEWIKDQINK